MGLWRIALYSGRVLLMLLLFVYGTVFADKICPVDGKHYPDSYLRCPVHGSLLKAAAKPKPKPGHAAVKSMHSQPAKPVSHPSLAKAGTPPPVKHNPVTNPGVTKPVVTKPTVTTPAVTAREPEKVYDAANEFAPENNPSGPWSYGYLSPDPKPNPVTFTAYKEWVKGQEGIDIVRFPGLTDPNVGHNGTGKVVTQEKITWEPNALTLHPNWQGFYSVVRWKCPREGIYLIEGGFQGADAKPTTTDVHVFHGVEVLFEDFVEGFGAVSAKRFRQTLTLRQDETIDFVVGWGKDHNNANDTTALEAKITFKP